jgi:hypothetical protein
VAKMIVISVCMVIAFKIKGLKGSSTKLNQAYGSTHDFSELIATVLTAVFEGLTPSIGVGVGRASPVPVTFVHQLSASGVEVGGFIAGVEVATFALGLPPSHSVIPVEFCVWLGIQQDDGCKGLVSRAANDAAKCAGVVWEVGV